jgi:hypothetical protein
MNWTEPLLQQIILLAKGSDAPDLLHYSEKLLKAAKNGQIDPFPISELPSYFTSRGVPESEAELLSKLKPTKPTKPKTPDVWARIQTLSEVSGKTVSTTVSDERLRPEDGKALTLWAKAVAKLPPIARKLFQERVRRIVYDPTARMEAQWRNGGTLILGHKGPSLDVLVHELGHALEEKLGLTITAWDETPYGVEPYPSAYASMGAHEDFAETFRMLLLERAFLKSKSPERFVDMEHRLR